MSLMLIFQKAKTLLDNKVQMDVLVMKRYV